MAVKEFDIDMSKVNSYVDGRDEMRVIGGQLRRRGFFNKNCLYTVVNEIGVGEVKRGVNYRRHEPNLIYAFDKVNLRWESDVQDRGLSDYCDDVESSILIWDKSKFAEGLLRYSYSFNKGEDVSSSLIAIARLV